MDSDLKRVWPLRTNSTVSQTAEPLRPGRQVIPNRTHVALAALSFTALAIYGSLVPLEYRPLELAEALQRFRDVPMLQLNMVSRADWVANLLLFVPIGFLWLSVWSMDRPKWLTLIFALIIVPACMALSVALEFAQLWFPMRTVSKNDIIAQAIGAVGGAVLWPVIGQSFIDWLRNFATEFRPKKQIDWLLQFYLLGFLIHSLLPLDLTVSFSELYHKFQNGRILLVPFQYSHGSTFSLIYELTIDVILFVPIGAWIATAFTRNDRVVRPLAVCLLFAAALASVIEFAQVLVYSRIVDTTDILTQTLGAAAGAWWMGRWFAGTQSPAPACRRQFRGLAVAALWLIAAMFYSVAVTALFWSPLEFVWDVELARQRWAEFFRTPLTALYLGTEYNAVEQVLRKLLFFAPLGLILSQAAAQFADWRLRRFLLAVLFAASAALAMGIELGQLFQPSHVADFTDVLLCAAGAAFGMTLGARILKGITQSQNQPIAQRVGSRCGD
jgi:glycopeptide antibiotics resistance protein